jgi:hypothetical protein
LFGSERARAFLRRNRFGMPFAPGARRTAAAGAPALARGAFAAGRPTLRFGIDRGFGRRCENAKRMRLAPSI